MKAINTKLYHLFLVIVVLHILAYGVFLGNTAIDIQHSFGQYSNELFNYFLVVSILILLIWFSYIVARKKLTSRKLVALHLLVIVATAFILPRFLFKFYNPVPRRYYMYDSAFRLNRIFGDLTITFVFVTLIFIASEVLLLLNIKRRSHN